MPSLTSKYAEAKTCVFWDMEDCPIPNGLNPESIYENIKTALANKGYGGEVTIWAYGDKNQIPGYFEDAGIKLVPAGDKHARALKMILEFFGWNREHGLSNMLVISSDNMDFSRSLRAYNDLGHNVLLAHPQHAPTRCRKHALDLVVADSAEWLWESLAAAGDPITRAS